MDDKTYHHPESYKMSGKDLQVPDADPPAYEMPILDRPNLVERPRDGGGDTVHIGVLKYSVNHLSKTTIALISGVIVTLIVAAAVVLCVVLTRPSRSSQQTVVVPQQVIASGHMQTINSGLGSADTALSTGSGSRFTDTVTLTGSGSVFTDTVTLTGLGSSFTDTPTSSGSDSAPGSGSGSGPSPGSASAPASASASGTSSTSKTSTSTTSSTSTSSATASGSPLCKKGNQYSGSHLMQLDSRYTVYTLKAIAAVTHNLFGEDQYTNIAAVKNVLFFCADGYWDLVVMQYCPSGVVEGAEADKCKS